MEFLPDISKWTQILLRWGHVFFAILWVGTSFTFNYLDNKLPKNLKEEDIEADGILQHSGYYYKLTRYHGVPTEVPKNVIIWKYTSYLTFLSGIALLILIYSEFKKNIDKRKIPMVQMMRDEALKAFELWDKKKDKVKY